MFSGWSLLSRVAIPSYHSYLETAMFCESVQYIWQPWVTQPWIFQIIRAHEPLRRCSIGKILVRSIRPKNLCELWKYVDVKAEECEMYEPERCQTNICLFGVKLVKPGEVGDTLCIYILSKYFPHIYIYTYIYIYIEFSYTRKQRLPPCPEVPTTLSY